MGHAELVDELQESSVRDRCSHIVAMRVIGKSARGDLNTGVASRSIKAICSDLWKVSMSERSLAEAESAHICVLHDRRDRKAGRSDRQRDEREQHGGKLHTAVCLLKLWCE